MRKTHKLYKMKSKPQNWIFSGNHQLNSDQIHDKQKEKKSKSFPIIRKKRENVIENFYLYSNQIIR